ncbi:VanZ family protein [Gelidibacter mesophilus]|uniref:VanZ family protein n=1 Tax=Gelidibacter mesophilus TaxID=169050 RepID=UPI0003F519E5|nr:VanZ family protein [Gelidibacter mesophilus]
MSLRGIPSLGTSFDDKIGHFGAYSIFTLLIFNYCISLKVKSPLVYAFAIATIYGFLMELLQKLLTTGREFDLYDALANAFGAVIAVVFITVYRKLKLK